MNRLPALAEQNAEVRARLARLRTGVDVTAADAARARSAAYTSQAWARAARALADQLRVDAGTTPVALSGLIAEAMRVGATEFYVATPVLRVGDAFRAGSESWLVVGPAAPVEPGRALVRVRGAAGPGAGDEFDAEVWLGVPDQSR